MVSALAGLVMFGVSPGFVGATGNDTSAGVGAARKGRAPLVAAHVATAGQPRRPRSRLGHEVPGLRTAKSDTFVDSHGVKTTRIYAQRVNFKDASGDMQPIDNSLVGSTAAGYAYTNKANDYDLQLPEDAGGAPVKVSKGGRWMSVSLDGAAGAGSVDGATETFHNALPAVTDAYTAEGDAVEESLVLADPSAPSSVSYHVRGSSGLTAKLIDRRHVELVDSAGDAGFVLSAPAMTDSSGATSHGLSLTLEQSDDGWTVGLSASRGWLKSADYPVIVDPMISFVGADQDCTVRGGSTASSNLCGQYTLDVGYDGSAASRSLLQFDIGQYIPADAKVYSARLGLHLSSATSGATTSVSLHRLAHSWTFGTTWDRYDGVSAWASPGGDFDSTAADTESVAPTTGWHYWYPTQLVRNWLNGTANDGLILKQDGETTNQLLRFDATTVAPTPGMGVARGNIHVATGTSPFLDVSYDTRIGQKRFYKLESQALDDRMTEKVEVTGGNLLIHNADLRIKGTGLNLAVDRFFNNQALTNLDYGAGWNATHGGDVQLVFYDHGPAVYYDPSGAPWEFDKNADGTYADPSGLDATLTKQSDGTYQIKYHKDSVKYNFDSDGYETSEVDRNDNKISIAYTTVVGLKSVSSITDTQGRTTRFTYNSAGYISALTDPAGRVYEYYYDDYGDLAYSYDQAGGRTDYFYDAYGDLVQITDPVGDITTFTYDDQARVTSVTRVTSIQHKIGYGPTTTFAYNSGNTVVTDPNGNQTTYYYDKGDDQGKITKVKDALGHTRSKSYTGDANVQQYATGSGAQLNAQYDSNDNLTSVQAPTGAKSTLDYRDDTHPYSPTALTDPQGNTTSYAYDAKGNLSKVTNQNAAENTATLDHNADGTVSKSTDANGNVTNYGYDAKGNLTSVTPPSPLGKETLTYDGLSRITSVTDGKGQKTTYAYDALDRITRISYADGTMVSYAYDVDGNRTSRTGRTGVVTTYGYDALNRTTQKSGGGGQTTTYGYDAASNLTSYTDSGGTVSYGYNAVNLVTSLTEPDGQRTTFGYDSDNNRTSTTYPNGVTITSHYDDSDRLTSTTAKNSGGTTLRSFSYDHTNPLTGGDSPLRWGVTDETGKKTTYRYDVLARLTSATNAYGGDYTYTYDGNGNMKTRTVGGSTTDYTYNAANELTSADYAFDADGNRTTGGGASFAYNAANQTTTITPSGGTALSLAYAGNDQAERSGAGSTTYTNALLGVANERSGGTTYFTRDNRGELVDERTPSGKFFYLFDGLGSVVGLTDSAGNLVATYKYDPYGRQVSSTGSVANPWRFAGQYRDSSTGLYHMGARYYDPQTGRWTQQDPIRHIPDFQQADRYVYAGGNPVNLTDPSGQDVGDFVSSCAESGATGAGINAVDPAGSVVSGFAVGCTEGLVSEGARELLGDTVGDLVDVAFAAKDLNEGIRAADDFADEIGDSIDSLFF